MNYLILPKLDQNKVTCIFTTFNINFILKRSGISINDSAVGFSLPNIINPAFNS